MSLDSSTVNGSSDVNATFGSEKNEDGLWELKFGRLPLPMSLAHLLTNQSLHSTTAKKMIKTQIQNSNRKIASAGVSDRNGGCFRDVYVVPFVTLLLTGR